MSSAFATPMGKARIAIVIVGIVLPYLARLPGMATHGADWLGSYFGGGLSGFLFLGAFNALCWGAILAISCIYRHPQAIWFPALPGFAASAVMHASLDLSADAQAAVALVFIPIYSLPGVLLGGLAGWWFDRRISRP